MSEANKDRNKSQWISSNDTTNATTIFTQNGEKYTQAADLKFQKRDLIEFHNWESQSSKQHFLEQNKA